MPFEEYYRNRRELYGSDAVRKHYPVGCNKTKIDKEPLEDYLTKSLLTVVADSATVEVWLISATDLNYISEKQDLKRVYEEICCLREPDRPYHEMDIEFVKDQFAKWDNHKMALVEQIQE